MARPPRSRQPIKDAALKLFVERGIHATGIRDIAGAAGCSEAALYRHWDNKDDLITSLFREHVTEVVTILDRELNEPGPPSSRLLGALSSLCDYYDRSPYAFRLVLLVQHDLGPLLPAEVRMPHAAVGDFVFQIDPQIPTDQIQLQAAAAIGAFIECSSRVIYGHLSGPIGKHLSTVHRLCCRILDIR
ncbi:MAG: TetR/AcrR family transcriptional regulator [Planctomycetota bacterium]|nr:MAG: TetR/AcrR family transcriptional regulator [Planctomycetota bacterium]